MTATRTRVVYVGGTGRSGSTVLANVLGEVPGLVSVGEVRFLWERGILQNRLCGCGDHFADCPFWSKVLDRAFGPDDERRAEDRSTTARRMCRSLAERTRMRSLPSQVGRRQRAIDPELATTLGRLYEAIAEVAGAEVVVDSSKLPTYAVQLADVPSITVQVLHLVRDPRAAAHSWRRRRAQPDLGETALMERRGAAKSAVLWRIWNTALERMCRSRGLEYRLLNYESFVADPRGELRRLLRGFALLAPSQLDPVLDELFEAPDVVRLSSNHTVAGNPARHHHGSVALVPDDEWRDRLGAADRRLVSVLTWPTLPRFGYRARV
ncbi:sulfotransferase [Nocardioides sp. SR21]|uniref:sulfotransferase n=1 Tax=Nocardioides sp. SR21 TaxID=2919501 RepID=UPI001FAB0743|nr:sulfotransferase [Nocardioides sp. SR21]